MVSDDEDGRMVNPRLGPYHIYKSNEMPRLDVIFVQTEDVEEKVERARREVRAQGLRFLGAAAVMAKSFMHKARSYEAKRKINPVLAARDVSVREAIRGILRAFQRSYAEALAAF